VLSRAPCAATQQARRRDSGPAPPGRGVCAAWI